MVPLRKRPWRSIRRFWRSYHWYILLGFAGLGFLLGVVGFHRCDGATSSDSWDALYRSLQLFVLEFSECYMEDGDGRLQMAPPNSLLHVARFSTAAVTFLATGQVLSAVLPQWMRIRARLEKDHVVLCGVGDKGQVLAKALLERGESLIIIDKDATNGGLALCRDSGAVVLTGDASDALMLRRARVERASELIALCGDDATNADIAATARSLVAGRQRGELNSFVHLVDSDLCDLLREHERLMRSAAFSLEFFNVFERGARLWLDECTQFDEAVQSSSGRSRLVIVGLGQMGEALLVAAVRRWLTLKSDGDERLPIAVVDRAAISKGQLLNIRHPQLDSVSHLVPYEIDYPSAEFEQAAFLFKDGSCDAMLIYVCFDDPGQCLSAGLALRTRVREYAVPIWVRATSEVGLTRLLTADAGGAAKPDGVRPFPLLDRTCTPESVRRETWDERLAQAIHEEYLRHAKPTGTTDASMVEWRDLSEGLKESNRRQAHHVKVKLKAIRCSLVASTEASVPFELSRDEVEQLAEMEHRRWMAERIFEGWRYGSAKDADRKISPYLISWEELPDTIKELDRNTVCNIPEFLAKVGLGVRRDIPEGATDNDGSQPKKTRREPGLSSGINPGEADEQ